VDLKSLLKGHIDSENFQGVALRIGSGSEVHWWNYGETELKKFCLDVEIKKSVSFSCINGNLRILD
jgi:hypothetical protein